MPFARPTLAELITRTTADLVSRLELTGTVLRRAVVRVLARVWAGAVHMLYGHLDWNFRQLFASTAEAEQLDLHGQDYAITRKAAAFATGDVTFTGTDASTIPAGRVVQRSDGVQFEVQTEVAIAAGTATTDVRALEAGDESNTDAGVVLALVSPISGVQSAVTVASAGITNGADTESDESYRTRILERKRSVPQGGSANDYIRWAKEVSGVTRVWLFPQWMGAGTVGVGFVLDDADPIIPDTAKVQEVQDYIDAPSRRPVTAEVIAFAPITLAVDMTINLVPDTTAVRNAVIAELEDLFRREAVPGAVIRLSVIDEAISIAPGETSHDLVAPVADIAPDANELPILGTITWV